MIDLGRPLHAYDADKVEGGKLTVRLAKQGEQVEALNEKTYTLETGALIIGDAAGPDDLAGIMGGERTGVSETTTRMFLEIAVFDPIAVAITGRKLNLHSDARYRFERGLDACSPSEMAGYIARLVNSICGGTISHLVVEGNAEPARQNLSFAPEKTRQLTGVDCPLDKQAEILSILGFELDTSQPIWQVAVPHWRNDIDGAADLVEEIIRIYGFDKLEMASLPRDEVVARPSYAPAQKRSLVLRRTLASRGLTEAVTFSFLKRSDAELFGGDNDALMLANPISNDLNMMRPSVVPNLLQAMGRNLNRGIEEVCFFEIGPVFLSPDADGQRMAVGGVRQGRRQLGDWQQQEQRFDLFDAKADLLAALSVLGVRVDNLVASREVPAWLHPGRSGVVRLGKAEMGVFGEVHPANLPCL
jgi:phenylalanyl-tRNA synthetase beta chain